MVTTTVGSGRWMVLPKSLVTANGGSSTTGVWEWRGCSGIGRFYGAHGHHNAPAGMLGRSRGPPGPPVALVTAAAFRSRRRRRCGAMASEGRHSGVYRLLRIRVDAARASRAQGEATGSQVAGRDIPVATAIMKTTARHAGALWGSGGVVTVWSRVCAWVRVFPVARDGLGLHAPSVERHG